MAKVSNSELCVCKPCKIRSRHFNLTLLLAFCNLSSSQRNCKVYLVTSLSFFKSTLFLSLIPLSHKPISNINNCIFLHMCCSFCAVQLTQLVGKKFLGGGEYFWGMPWYREMYHVHYFLMRTEPQFDMK